MKPAFYVIALVCLAVPAIRFLIRASTDRLMQNGLSDFMFLAHDSTVGAYEEQGRRMAQEMDEEVEGLQAIREERSEAIRQTRIETRTEA